jgi:hypothetical protein
MVKQSTGDKFDPTIPGSSCVSAKKALRKAPVEDLSVTSSSESSSTYPTETTVNSPDFKKEDIRLWLFRHLSNWSRRLSPDTVTYLGLLTFANKATAERERQRHGWSIDQQVVDSWKAEVIAMRDASKQQLSSS